MPTYTIAANELQARVNPLDGTMWKCMPITVAEVNKAISAGIVENRAWDDLVNKLGYEASREFHINRIATFVRQPPTTGRIIMILENHTCEIRAYLNDGNHRLAAAYIRGDADVTLAVAASVPDGVKDVFPSARLVEPEAVGSDA